MVNGRRIIQCLWILIFFILCAAHESNGDGSHCVMFGGTQGLPPHVYNGKPIPLTDDAAITILQQNCPDFNFVKNSPVCCNVSQVTSFGTQVAMLAGIFQRCPICLHNMQNIFCPMICSPNQSDFLMVHNTRSPTPDEKALINTTWTNNIILGDPDILISNLSYYMTDTFASILYDSCTNVQLPSGNTRAIQLVCGSYGVANCNPHNLLQALGSNPISPMLISFNFMNNKTLVNGTQISPMNMTAFPCDGKLPSGLGPCSCADCNCSSIPFPEPDSPFTIFNMDPMIVIMSFVFGALLIFITAGFILHVYYREYREDDSGGSGEGYESDTYPPVSPVSKEELGFVYKVSAFWDDFLCKSFTMWGRFCCRNPFTVLVLGLACVIGLSTGLLFFKVTTDPVELWAIPGSKGLQEKEYYDNTFRPFYRTEQVIVTRTNTTGGNTILANDFILQVLDLQQKITNLTGETESGEKVTLSDICFSPLNNGECTVQSVPNWFQNNETLIKDGSYMNHIRTCSENPFQPKDDQFHSLSCFGVYGGPVFPYVALGGYTDNNYTTARALIITIMVNNHVDQNLNKKAKAWEIKFVEFMKNYTNPNMSIAFNSERSIEDEINRESESDILTIALSYTIMFIYVSIALGRYQSCSRLPVESQIMLGLSGVLLVLASVVSSLGFFSYFGIKSTLIIVEVIPFLVLAVGVDNIFILVQAYQREEGKWEGTLEDCIGQIMGRVAPSLLLASSSESICFFLGYISPMPAVRMFALFAGMALLIVFLLQISCFVALLSLDARRQQADRVDILCCLKGSAKIEVNQPGYLYIFFKKVYSPFLMKDPVRVAVMVLFVGWFCTSAAVVDKLSVGLDQKLSMPDDSFVLRYFNFIAEYLSVGPPVYFVVKSGFNYSDFAHQNAICSSINCTRYSLTTQLLNTAHLANRSYIAQPSNCWLDDYIDWTMLPACCKINKYTGEYCPTTSAQTNCTPCLHNITAQNYDRPAVNNFNEFIPDFLNEIPDANCAKGGHASSKEAIQINPDGSIGATFFMTYHTVLKTSQDFTEALRWARKISDNITTTLRNATTGNPKIEVFPYSIFYVFYEQYLDMWAVTLRSLLVSGAAIFVVTFLFMGLNLHCACIIFLTITMIVVDMMGLMFFWNIELNGISLVNLVMAVGISVEFCSHVTRAFTISSRPSRQRRAQDALAHMGSSVLSGITFTKFGGILVLAFAKSQIFQVFYFRMYLGIVLFGAAHGLIFLPVLLSIIGPPVNPVKRSERLKRQYKPLTQ